MKNLLAFICLTFFLTSFLQAQENQPDNFHQTQLSNGLEVLVVEDPTVPLATIELAVKTGSINESAETNGLSHLFEHLFFKANQQYPSKAAIEDKIEELGIVFNATTSAERANFTINLSNQHVAEGIAFMSAAIQQPLFSDTAIKSEQPVIEAKFQQAESNPVHYLILDINKKLWGDQTHRKNALGEQPVIANATPEQLAQIHQRFYVPNNSILIVAGDVSHEDVFSAVKENFGTWKAPEQPPHQQFPVPDFPPLTQSAGVVTLNENAESPIVISAFRGPTTQSDRKATYAADVFTYMLSQSKSKLNQNLVATGTAYQVGVGYTTQKHGAPFTFFLVPKAEGISEAVAALENNLTQMDSDDYFTDEELENAKRMLIIQELYSREAPSEVVHNISYWWASADIDYFTDYIKNIEAVTREDINALVNTYIQGQPNVTGILITYEMKEMLRMNSFQPLKTQE